MLVRYTSLRAAQLRFRRWSRAAYASFLSIGREVSIGVLKAGVVERLYVKALTAFGLCSSDTVKGVDVYLVLNSLAAGDSVEDRWRRSLSVSRPATDKLNYMDNVFL